MPRSPAARTVRRKASTPRRCPSTRGRPCAAAQRPLPSMMMATCRGAAKPSACRRRRRRRLASRSCRVAQTVMISFSLPASSFSTSRDSGVGRLLHFAGLALLLVLADLVLLLQLLEQVETVAADVAHRHARSLGVFVRDLHDFAPPLFIELGNAQLDDSARRSKGSSRDWRRKSPSRSDGSSTGPRPGR